MRVVHLFRWLFWKSLLFTHFPQRWSLLDYCLEEMELMFFWSGYPINMIISYSPRHLFAQPFTTLIGATTFFSDKYDSSVDHFWTLFIKNAGSFPMQQFKKGPWVRFNEMFEKFCPKILCFRNLLAIKTGSVLRFNNGICHFHFFFLSRSATLALIKASGTKHLLKYQRWSFEFNVDSFYHLNLSGWFGNFWKTLWKSVTLTQNWYTLNCSGR